MEVATAFFHACEQGKGWEECRALCSDESTFSVQALDALPVPKVSECVNIESYVEWMKAVVENMKDKATYEVHAAAFDEIASTALFFATFAGSHYVYVVRIANGKVAALTKIWNDVYAAKAMASSLESSPIAARDNDAEDKEGMEVATAFLHACDKGLGWDTCKSYCTENGTFTVQAVDALSGPPPVTACKSLEQYAEWMRGNVEAMGDRATYDIHASAFDSKSSIALFYFTFAGSSHNVYAIRVDNAKVVALIKIWNDAYAAAPPPPPPTSPPS